MAQEVKVKIVGRYNGHDVKPNKAVNIKFLFEYSEMLSYIKLHQLINENIDVQVKIGDAKPTKLGSFMLDKYNLNKNGECSVQINSTVDHAEVNNINLLSEEPSNPIQILFKAEVEKEDAEEDEDND